MKDPLTISHTRKKYQRIRVCAYDIIEPQVPKHRVALLNWLDPAMELGDWEYEKMAGGFFLQSGVYCFGAQKRRDEGQDARQFREEIRAARKIEDLLVAEMKAGAIYFMRWRGLEMRFKGDAPPHWRVYVARAGNMLKGRGGMSRARHAATPVGAMLNYAYIVTLGQVTRRGTKPALICKVRNIQG